MSVRMPPCRSARAQIAMLEPSEKEVWEVRARVPNLEFDFGRFARKTPL